MPWVGLVWPVGVPGLEIVSSGSSTFTANPDEVLVLDVWVWHLAVTVTVLAPVEDQA